MDQDLTRHLYHDIYTEEYFYTFLKPFVINYKSETYYVWGYCEVMNEIRCLSATKDLDTPWTKATCFTDEKLVEELKKYLPIKVIKRKRRKHE